MATIDIDIKYEGGKLSLAAIRHGKNCEFDDFLTDRKKNDFPAYAKLKRLIVRLCDSGHIRNTEQFRCLDGKNKLWELKSNNIRILCFFDHGKLVICTHGFVKKRQKTPAGEIEKALRMRKEYLAHKPGRKGEA